MDKLSFKLPVFEGPLDLLLHLIVKNKIDIYDIPIEEITRQYFDYLQSVQEFDMELGSEFLVMAAQLLYIKSKMLLPVDTSDEEDAEDPRTQLVEKLLDYQAYQQLAKFLREKENGGEVLYYKTPEKFNFKQLDYDNQSFDLSELTQAFYLVYSRKKEVAQSQGVKNLEAIARHQVYSIPDKIEEIKELLDVRKKMLFSRMFDDYETKSECISVFLAILEMIKSSLIRLTFLPQQHDYQIEDGVQHE